MRNTRLAIAARCFDKRVNRHDKGMVMTWRQHRLIRLLRLLPVNFQGVSLVMSARIALYLLTIVNMRM